MKKLTIDGLYRELMPGLSNVYGRQEARQMLLTLFEDLLNISRQQFLANPEQYVDPVDAGKIRQASSELRGQMPLQYITGKTEFFDMELLVKPGVLIPRPETEEMVYLVKNEYLNRKKPQNILDVGTGSGCIALALKNIFPDSDVIALDHSAVALDIAKSNANKLGLEIDFIRLNFLDKSERESLPGRFDLIISNPPYVRESDKPLMCFNVLDHEPHQALFVEDREALVFYKALCDYAAAGLTEGGMIVAEINEALGREVHGLFNNHFRRVEIIEDMSGKERFVLAAS